MIARLNLKWLFINVIALLLLVVGLSFWQQQAEQAGSEQEKTYTPDYFMLDATSIQYDPTGLISSQISGQRFAHINEFAATDIEAPRFQFFRANNAPWFGRAETATVIDSGAQIALDKKVFITNGPAPENPLSLVTESLRILPNQNLLTGSEQVTIQGRSSQLQAHGIKLQMDTQVLTLLRQVRGEIQPGN